MPETATMNARDHTRSDRIDLKNARTALDDARFKLQQLESGQEKAREKSWNLAAKVETAQSDLAKLQEAEQRRLASAWVQDDTVDVSPIPASEHALASARKELENIHRVEAAIAGSIPIAQRKLDDAQRAFYEELGTSITTSESYRALAAAHTEAWKHLRTIRAVLGACHAAAKGQVSQAWLDASQLVEPLAPAAGRPINIELLNTWKTALDQLTRDPDAQLPPPS